jgi:O-antigen biosynthesis protein
VSRRKRILLTGYNVDDGLVYQRGHLPLMELNRDRWEVVPKSWQDLSHSDFFYADCIILIHAWNGIAQHIAERARYHYGIPVIVDLDDLMHDLPSDHPEYVYSTQAKVAHILGAADYGVFATDYLAHAYGHMVPRRKVIPNSISRRIYEAYKPANKPYKTGYTFGFTGGQTHRPDIYNTWLDDVDRFLSDYPDSRFYAHVLCPERLLRRHGTQVVYDPAPCDFLDYPGVSAAYPMDCLLVGLTDHPFNNAKSDLKLLEMAPHEIPIIASPRSDFIQHSSRQVMLYAENNSPEYAGWYQQMQWAYYHQDEMQEMARRARDYVMSERTSVDAMVKWAEVLNELLSDD